MGTGGLGPPRRQYMTQTSFRESPSGECPKRDGTHGPWYMSQLYAFTGRQVPNKRWYPRPPVHELIVLVVTERPIPKRDGIGGPRGIDLCTTQIFTTMHQLTRYADTHHTSLPKPTQRSGQTSALGDNRSSKQQAKGTYASNGQSRKNFREQGARASSL